MFKEDIFKAYDIRGEYGKDFDNEFAKKLGSVLVKYLGAKKIVIARDMRESSGELAKEVIEGITSMGCDVVDIGSTSTPLYYFGVISESADGGIMITASHLGEEFNGFKVTKRRAISIGGHELLEKARELFENPNSPSKKKGEIINKNLLEEYANASIEHSGVKEGEIKTPIKLIGNEMVLKEIRAVANKLSINVVDEKEEIGFEFDPDGDRISVLNASGEKIRGDLVGGLLAGYYLEGKRVAYDLRYSRGVLEYLESKKIEAIPSRIGHTLIKKVMRENELEFCGEQSGHMFFKEMGYVEASALAMLKILNVLKETGRDIDELAGGVSNWSTTDEINFNLDSRDKISELLKKAKGKYSDGNINETDGVRIEYSDWGFLLRASNTEAKLRLIVDAKTESLMNKKKEELVNLLQE